MRCTPSRPVAVAALWCCLSAASPATALAAGIRDVADGWLVSPGATAGLLGEELVGRTGREPAGGGAWVAIGRMNLFGMSELPTRRLAAGLRGRWLSYGAAWQRLGAALYNENSVRVRCLVDGRRVLGGGVVAGWDDVALAAGRRRRRLAVAGLLCIDAGERTRLEIVGHLLDVPSWHGSRSWRRWLRIEHRTAGVVGALALDRRGNGAPAAQLELQVRLVAGAETGAGVGLRLEPACGAAGFTTAWRRRAWLIRSSHLVHPDLGVTHRWSLTAGSFEAAW